ncbi:voltage-gated cation channel [Pycnococcus provasolii]
MASMPNVRNGSRPHPSSMSSSAVHPYHPDEDGAGESGLNMLLARADDSSLGGAIRDDTRRGLAVDGGGVSSEALDDSSFDGGGDSSGDPGDSGEGDDKAFQAMTLKHRLELISTGNNAYLFISPENPLRQFCVKVVISAWFDKVILVCILANCAFLAMDDAGCKDTCRTAVDGAEFVFTFVFTAEFILKTVSHCLFFGPKAYINSAWNCLDMLCVVTAYLQYVGAGGNVSGLRAFRAMRPLRAVKALPGLRVLVATLMESLPLLRDVALMLVWLLLVFGIVGVQMFMGKLTSRCVVVEPQFQDEVIGSIVPGMRESVCASSVAGYGTCPTGSECRDVGMNPDNGFTSFDNFLWASLSIMRVVVLKSWSKLYVVTMAASGDIAIPFYLLLVLTGSYFAVKLLVVVLVGKFAQVSAILEQELAEARSVSMWTRVKLAMGMTVIPRSDQDRHVFALYFKTFVASPPVERVITSLIIANTVTMAMEHYGMSDDMKHWFGLINLMFTVCFSIEFLMKLAGEGVYDYWSSASNNLDGICVLVSVAELYANVPNSGLSALRSFRLLRILRSLRALQKIDSLRKTMLMVIRGATALSDFVALTMVFIFIFCLLGMQVFGGQPAFDALPHSNYTAGDPVPRVPANVGTFDPDGRRNFNSLPEAAMTVLEMLTANNWIYVMHRGMQAAGDAASLYFLSWIFLGHLTLLTLFLAIVITQTQSPDEEKPQVEENKSPKGSPRKALQPKSSDERSRTALKLPEEEKSQRKTVRDSRVKPVKMKLMPDALRDVAKMKIFLVSIDEKYGVGDVDEEDLTDPEEAAKKAEESEEEELDIPPVPEGLTALTNADEAADDADYGSFLKPMSLYPMEAFGYGKAKIEISPRKSKRRMSLQGGAKHASFGSQGGSPPQGASGRGSGRAAKSGRSSGRTVISSSHSDSSDSLKEHIDEAHDAPTPARERVRESPEQPKTQFLRQASASPKGEYGGSYSSRKGGLKFVPSMTSIHEEEERRRSLAQDEASRDAFFPTQAMARRTSLVPADSGGGRTDTGGGGLMGMVDAMYPPPAQPADAWGAPAAIASSPATSATTMNAVEAFVQQQQPSYGAGGGGVSTRRDDEAGRYTPKRPTPRQAFPNLTPGRGGIPTPRRSPGSARARTSKGGFSARSMGSDVSGPSLAEEPISLTEDDCVQLSIYQYGPQGPNAPMPEFGDDITMAMVVREYTGGDDNIDDGTGGEGPVLLRRGVENPFKFTFGGASAGDHIVEGMEVALPSLPMGCKANLFCHAEYAAGLKDADGNVVIGKHLIFDIEVLDVRKSWMVGNRPPGPVTESTIYPDADDEATDSMLLGQANRVRSRATKEDVERRLAEKARNTPWQSGSPVKESRDQSNSGGIGRFTLNDGMTTEEEDQRRQRRSSLSVSLQQMASSMSSFSMRNVGSFSGADSSKSSPSPSQIRRSFSRRRSSMYKARNSLFKTDSGYLAQRFAAVKSMARDSFIGNTYKTLRYRKNSFMLFSEGNRFRRMCKAVVSHKSFEGLILTLICIGGVFLAIDDPRLDKKSALKQVLVYCDMVFTCIYTVEMLLKMVANGFCMHEGSYWQNGWNQLDGIIVCTSLASITGSDELSIVRVFRLLRVLRPLRMISRIEGMQIVVNTVIHAFPSIINIVMFGIFQTIVFAIMMTQMFNGRLGRCNDSVIDGVQVLAKDACVPTGVKFVCNLDEGDVCELEEHGTLVVRHWFSPYLNFDHIGESLKSLFVLTTLDNWVDVAHAAMDAKGVDMIPQRNTNAVLGSFSVISFVILGSIFWPCMFIGTLVDHYLKVASKGGSSALETSMQAEAMERRRKEQIVEKMAQYYRLQVEPKLIAPRMALRRTFFKLVTSTPFDYFIVVCILVNTACMAVTFKGMDRELEMVLGITNFAFNGVFMLEAVLKLIGLGWEQYQRSSWNRFDLFLIVVNLPEFFITVGAGLTVFRIFRIGRLFRLLKRAKGLRALFETAITALPSIGNVSSLLFLLIFMYAILGMNLFGTGRLEEHEHPRLSDRFKFEGFGNSLIVLWRVFTGDEWSMMMRSAAKCKVGRPCPSPFDDILSMAYFSSFLILARYVLLNLIVAVLLEKFLNRAKEENLLEVDTFFAMVRKRFLLSKFEQKMKMAASGTMARESRASLEKRIAEKKRREVELLRKAEELRSRPRPLQGPFPKSIRSADPKWLREHTMKMREIAKADMEEEKENRN